MLPSPDILNEFELGRFVLSNLAAKRANQIKEGAPPLVQIDSHHPLTIALAEIAAGKIKPIMNAVEEAIEDQPSITLIGDEPLPAELGMLLPALDETEADLVGIESVLGEDDLEADTEDSEDVVISLSDLADEDEDETVAPAAAEDDTLSLTDVAEQESIEEEEVEE